MTWLPTAAHGASVTMGNAASPEVFTALSGLTAGPNGPGFQPNIIEARHHGAIATIRKVSHVDVSPVTFSLLYDSADTQHVALVASGKAGTRKNFHVILADTGAEQYAFAAFVSTSVKADEAGYNMLDVTLTVDGDATIT